MTATRFDEVPRAEKSGVRYGEAAGARADSAFRDPHLDAKRRKRRLVTQPHGARHTSAHVPAVGGSYLQVHFGVSGRAGSAHGVMPLLLTASLRTLLAEKPTAVEAAICSASPVLGFRPVRAARARAADGDLRGHELDRAANIALRRRGKVRRRQPEVLDLTLSARARDPTVHLRLPRLVERDD